MISQRRTYWVQMFKISKKLGKENDTHFQVQNVGSWWINSVVKLHNIY